MFFTSHYTCVLCAGVPRVSSFVPLLCGSFFSLLFFTLFFVVLFLLLVHVGVLGGLLYVLAGEFLVSGKDRCSFPRLLG